MFFVSNSNLIRERKNDREDKRENILGNKKKKIKKFNLNFYFSLQYLESDLFIYNTSEK